MPKRSTKHNREQILRYVDFSGGLNLSQNEETIKDNELSQAENWEYSFPTGKLKTRDGLEFVKNLGVNIDTLFYADNLKIFLFSSGNTLYKLVGDVSTNLGTLSSTDVPQYALWGDKVLIASGGTLQSYDGTTLNSTGSPDTNIVFIRVGRVVVSKSGSDKLTFSGIGDEENWAIGTDADMIEIDIGYKDGGDIISVVALATDIVVFKDSGSIFRVAGEYPDWAVYEITRSQTALTRFATVQAGNDVFFLSPTGFMSLNAVQEYGNIKTSEEGYKVNHELAISADSGAKIWHVSSKGQIWVRTETSEYIWIYHTPIRAWTKFKFPSIITAHTSLDDGTEYVAMDQTLYKINGYTDDGVDIISNLRLKKQVARNEYFIKRMSLEYFRHIESLGSISTGLLSIPFSIPATGDIAYLDTDTAFSDNDLLVELNANKLDAQVRYRTEVIEPQVQLTTGSITLKNLILNIVEV